MHRSNLPIVTATLLTLASFAIAEPVAATTQAPMQAMPSSASLLSGEAQPVLAGGGLCGLSSADVADIIDHYELEPDGPAMASALSAPFNCEAYPGACQTFESSNIAHTYACDVWLNLQAHVPLDEVQAAAVAQVENWAATSCNPDPEDCQDICGSRPVASCTGVYFAGKCHALAICDFFVIPHDIPFFDFLGPII